MECFDAIEVKKYLKDKIIENLLIVLTNFIKKNKLEMQNKEHKCQIILI